MMKRLIYTLLFTLAGLAGMAQTNEPLPGDAQPLTNQLYLSPSDSTVWAADPFSGLAIKVGTWFKVDSLFKLGYTKAQVDSALSDFNSISTPTKPGYRFTVVPNEDLDGDTIGATGISYREDTHEYIISYYSFAKESKLWFYERNSPNLLTYDVSGTLTPEPDREIDITPHIDHIQGNAWDADDEVYWVLGTQKGLPPLGTNRVLISVNDAGVLVSTYNLPFNFQVGQIAVKGDTLMIKPNNDSTLYFLDKTSKDLVRTEKTNISFEGLAYDSSRDLVWIIGDRGDIVAYDYDSFVPVFESTFTTLPDEVFRQNVEGAIIDPVDDKLVMAFDGFLHGENNNGNAMFKYDFPRYSQRVPKEVGTLALNIDTPMSDNVPVFEIKNKQDTFGTRFFTVRARGDVASRIFNAEGEPVGGLAFEYSRSQHAPRFRFLLTNADGSDAGTNYLIVPQEAATGLKFSYAPAVGSPDDGTNYFDMNYSDGVFYANQSTIAGISAGSGKATITKEFAEARYFSTEYTSPSNSLPYTGDMLALPEGNYSSGISSAASNRPDIAATGGYLSFGQNSAGVQGRFLSARTGIDLMLYSTGAVSNPWYRIASREFLSSNTIQPIQATQFRLSSLNTAPASATAPGTTGEIRYAQDGGVYYLYLCVSTNTWVRSALATWP